MERIYRKLQKISSSYFVSLPKTWIRNFELDKQSKAVSIDIRDDGSLIISPKLKQNEKYLDDKLVLNSSSYVGREMNKHFLSGIETIVIISDKEIDKNIRTEINWFVEGLPNTEIIEEERQRIVIQNFGFRKIPTRKVIYRLLYLICDMFDNILKGESKNTKENFKKLKRFYFILVNSKVAFTALFEYSNARA